ncbi:dihydroorotate dehydrogenase electron transfer subunit [uncultured Methanobrevibacter sp.]|uniref:dihydroorotate dehydrogenase electron transfer subunit n=1 Tax=uncultured Methanobrevibacter sp. TaxID=253161 RepID=UPI0025F6BB19|nr:dihydroorotate dehydrogenase electron transfer subunit [uncultured Methanobrevibacter sp.]
MNVPRVLKIKRIVEETPTIKSFYFDWNMEENFPSPGQFLMIWNFNDEKPMSISSFDLDNNEISITVKNIGPFTDEVHSLNSGDYLGLRGPYGHGFNVPKGKKILAIGGGVGMAPIAAFTDCAIEDNNVDVVCAAVTKNELLFEDRLIKSGANVYNVTDDGSSGYKGFATNRTIDLIESNTYDFAVVCGPEIMMKPIYDILEENNISSEYSLERYMKCAIGICGQCCVDKTGWRICKEGPVFNDEDLKLISEFANYRRAPTGEKI